MNIRQIKNVYFIGIGGIGMSALARYFKNMGKVVYGYDKTATALTSKLIDSGIVVHFEDKINLIPKDFYVENTLVVVTPAIPKTHIQWNYFVEREFRIKKRAEVLGIITQDTFCFAVAGTHGKTTTSSILGHILYESGVEMTAFLGGIVEGYDSNLIGTGKTISVVEADEFDRSFLHLQPNIACITSMDADHLDIYGDKFAIEASFIAFADKISNKENLFITSGLPIEGIAVGVENQGHYQAINIKIQNGMYLFDIQTPSDIVTDISFRLPGRHNILNAVLAFAMAKAYGISNATIIQALVSFRGVKRRFSYQIETDRLVYIDDYAHHPSEINAVHQALTEFYPNKKILVIFQPHLFTRTRDFIDDFAKSLSVFPQVMLLDIYPARELPIEGVDSKWLLNKINTENKILVTKKELLENIRKTEAEVIVTIGAGDIGEMVPMIKDILCEKIK